MYINLTFITAVDNNNNYYTIIGINKTVNKCVLYKYKLLIV